MAKKRAQNEQLRCAACTTSREKQKNGCTHGRIDVLTDGWMVMREDAVGTVGKKNR